MGKKVEQGKREVVERLKAMGLELGREWTETAEQDYTILAYSNIGCSFFGKVTGGNNGSWAIGIIVYHPRKEVILMTGDSKDYSEEKDVFIGRNPMDSSTMTNIAYSSDSEQVHESADDEGPEPSDRNEALRFIYQQVMDIGKYISSL